MKKSELLTTDILKKMLTYKDGALLSDTTKDSLYYKDLSYGIKRVFGLDVDYDIETEKRIYNRLIPERFNLGREFKNGYSDFSREFYYFYNLRRERFNDSNEVKSTRELAEIFKVKTPKVMVKSRFIDEKK